MFASNDFRYACGTLNACFLKTLPRIDDFIRCLGFAPTDIDGLVESNGNFLVLEFKDSRAQKFDTTGGQGLALRRLAELPQFNVLVITMFADQEEWVSVQWLKHEREPFLRKRADVCTALADWKAWTKDWDAADSWTAPWSRT